MANNNNCFNSEEHEHYLFTEDIVILERKYRDDTIAKILQRTKSGIQSRRTLLKKKYGPRLKLIMMLPFYKRARFLGLGAFGK